MDLGRGCGVALQSGWLSLREASSPGSRRWRRVTNAGVERAPVGVRPPVYKHPRISPWCSPFLTILGRKSSPLENENLCLALLPLESRGAAVL